MKWQKNGASDTPHSQPIQLQSNPPFVLKFYFVKLQINTKGFTVIPNYSFDLTVEVLAANCQDGLFVSS